MCGPSWDAAARPSVDRNATLLLMRALGRICAIAGLAGLAAFGQQPFLNKNQWTALRNEASGVAPYENLRYLTRLHRVPATTDFDEAASFIFDRAREYGLSNVRSEQFPIDGNKRYGLMRSYLAWTVQEGRLWELTHNISCWPIGKPIPFAWQTTAIAPTCRVN